MEDRALKLKQRQKLWGIPAKDVAREIEDGSIDTVRKLGVTKLGDETLDKIEAGIERARVKRIQSLQTNPTG